jgi:hypothetical protein
VAVEQAEKPVSSAVQAVFETTSDSGAGGSSVKTTVNVAEKVSPAARAPIGRVQAEPGAVSGEQDQPGELTSGAIRLNCGTWSARVTPEASWLPVFSTWIVKRTGALGETDAEARVFAMRRSGEAAGGMVTVSQTGEPVGRLAQTSLAIESTPAGRGSASRTAKERVVEAPPGREPIESVHAEPAWPLGAQVQPGELWPGSKVVNWGTCSSIRTESAERLPVF